MTVARDAQTTLNTGIATAGRIEMQLMALSGAVDDLADALEGDEITDLGAANTAHGALKAAIDAGLDLTDAQKADAVTALNAADVTIANAEIAKYEADAMADGATMEQMLAAYRGKLMAAQRLAAATAASAADLAKANMVIGAAGAKIAQLEEDIQDAKDDQADERRLASNAVSMQVAEAINDHTVPGDTPSEFMAPATASTAPDTDFGVSRSSGAAKFTLTQTVAQKRDKPYAMSSAPSAGTGWMGNSFTHSGTSAKRPFTEVGVVYTDIEMAGPVMWTADALNGVSGVTGLTLTGEAVSIGSGATVGASRLTGGILPSEPAADDDTGTERVFTAPTTSRSGTFFGVTGNFVCAGACTVERNIVAGADVVTVTTGTVIFTPSGPTPAGGRMAKYADPDTDYTYFGYWMKSTTLRDGTMEHDIETFHGGMGNLTADITTVTGTAKYYGAAAGVYVKKDGTGDSLEVTDGKFTADAMLTARFGGTAIAADDAFEVEGTISRFMSGGTNLGFADLALNKADIESTTGGTPPNDTVMGRFSGETDGGGTSGNWSGMFFGNANPTPTGLTDDFTDDYPTDVSGQFNGHFVNGHVAGAFGAEMDE